MKRSERWNVSRYSHAEIRTRVVVICGPMRYQLDHGGAQYIMVTIFALYKLFDITLYLTLRKLSILYIQPSHWQKFFNNSLLKRRGFGSSYTKCHQYMKLFRTVWVVECNLGLSQWTTCIFKRKIEAPYYILCLSWPILLTWMILIIYY